MNPVARMILIVGLMALIGLSALYFMAGRFHTAVQESSATQDQIAIFADARHAIREWLEKHPKSLESIRDERIDTADLMAISSARNRLLREAGMDEEVYKTIRQQYRAYRSSEGELDPAFQAAFDAAPADVMARADLKEFDALDF